MTEVAAAKPKRARTPRPPKLVHVGPYQVRLDFIDADGDDETNFGLFDPHRLVITLRVDVAPQSLVNTALHELWHAMHNAAGLEDGATEEDYATRGSLIFQSLYFHPGNKPFWRWVKHLQAQSGDRTDVPLERVQACRKS